MSFRFRDSSILPGPQEPGFSALCKQLRAVRRRWKIAKAVQGFLGATAFALTSLLLLCLLDSLLPLPYEAREVLILLLVFGFLFGLAAFSLRYLLASFPLNRVALLVESKAPELENIIINALQLGRIKQTEDRPETPLITALLDRANEQLKSVRRRGGIVDGRRLRFRLLSFCLAVACLTCYCAFFPDAAGNAILRFIDPSGNPGSGISQDLLVRPGNCKVLEGSLVRLEAQPIHSEPSWLKVGVSTWNPEANAFATERETRCYPENSIFVYNLNISTGLIRYHIFGERLESPFYTIQAVAPLRVNRLDVSYQYPEYLKEPARTDKDATGDIKAPEGTKILLLANTNKPVRRACLIIASGANLSGVTESVPMIVQAEREIQGEFRIERQASYIIQIWDREGFSDPRPPVHTILALRDEPPQIRIVSPEGDIQLAQGKNISVLVEASDDHALTDLQMVCKSPEDSTKMLFQWTIPQDAALRLREGFVWDLSAASPGQTISYWAEAKDNARAPQTSRSEVFHVRILGVTESAAFSRTGAPLGNLIDQDQSKKIAEASTIQSATEFFKGLDPKIDRFLVDQKKNLQQSRAIAQALLPDATEQRESLKNLAAVEEKWGAFFEDAVQDLTKLPNQDFSNPRMVEELIEIWEQVEKASKEIIGENITVAVKREEVILELATKWSEELEKWLSDIPDNKKWSLEEPLQPANVPMVELPDEMQDLVGDLIERADDMTDEIEDLSSSWADSLATGAGWDAVDGPISNMSAVGKTGNVLPNKSEVGGRSGEGRTGRAHGEFVEQSATGKGGRDTPARITADALTPGVIDDTSKDPVGGATGGGKISGVAAPGLRGPSAPEIPYKVQDLYGRILTLHDRTERFVQQIKEYNYPTSALRDGIALMKEIEDDLQNKKIQEAASKHKVVLKDLKEAKAILLEQSRLEKDASKGVPTALKEEILSAADEPKIAGFEDLTRDYYLKIAGSK